MRTISICFFSLFLILLPIKAKDDKPKEEAEPIPTYGGTYLNVDLFNPISHFLGTRFIQGEASVDVNIKNTIFPIIELGYGGVNYDNGDGLAYKSAAPFVRIGLNYNTMAKKRRENHFYIGVRYGFSAFKYDITSHGLSDPVWPDDIDFTRLGQKSFGQWIELVAGIRVQIKGNFMMGWSIRLKRLISNTNHGDNEAWYVPGYGYSGTTAYGATYSIIYKFNPRKRDK